MLNEMSSSRRACRNKTDVFGYICGEHTIVPYRKPVTEFIKRAYHTYFGMKLGNHDKAWAPHMVCKICIEYLRLWTNGKKSCLKFGIPMVWREPTTMGLIATSALLFIIYIYILFDWDQQKEPEQPQVS